MVETSFSTKSPFLNLNHYQPLHLFYWNTFENVQILEGEWLEDLKSLSAEVIPKNTPTRERKSRTPERPGSSSTRARASLGSVVPTFGAFARSRGRFEEFRPVFSAPLPGNSGLSVASATVGPLQGAGLLGTTDDTQGRREDVADLMVRTGSWVTRSKSLGEAYTDRSRNLSQDIDLPTWETIGSPVDSGPIASGLLSEDDEVDADEGENEERDELEEAYAKDDEAAQSSGDDLMEGFQETRRGREREELLEVRRLFMEKLLATIDTPERRRIFAQELAGAYHGPAMTKAELKARWEGEKQRRLEDAVARHSQERGLDNFPFDVEQLLRDGRNPAPESVEGNLPVGTKDMDGEIAAPVSRVSGLIKVFCELICFF